MIVKFINHSYKNNTSTGTNSINSAVGYLLNEEDRSKPPEVVKGDPEFVKEVANSIDNIQKYTSLVIAFRPEEKPTPKQQMEIIKEFEATAFAGLKEEDYTCLWVKHEDKGKIELHCLTPKINLSTGTALNIRPPGQFSIDLMDAFRDSVNDQHSWEKVEEGKSKIMPQMEDYELKKLANGIADSRGDFKDKLTKLLINQCQLGNIKTRNDVVKTLKKLRLVVVREGDNYLSIKHPTDPAGKNIRLKGGIYARSFELSGREQGIIRREKQPEPTKPNLTTEKKLERLVEIRANFNQARYGNDKKTVKSVESNSGRSIGTHSNSRSVSDMEISEIRKNYSATINSSLSATKTTTNSTNKEITNGGTNRIREKANTTNSKLGKAIGHSESSNSKVARTISNSAEANRSHSESNSKLIGEVGRIKAAHPPMNISALGSISSLEMAIVGEVAKLSQAQSLLEKSAIQQRINELKAQLEKAKIQYQEQLKHKSKGRGYGD